MRSWKRLLRNDVLASFSCGVAQIELRWDFSKSPVDYFPGNLN